MCKLVRWFWLDEELTIGIVLMNNKEVFVAEEAVRFDAPNVYVADSLRALQLQLWRWDEGDYNKAHPEDRKQFEEDLKRIEAKYKEES